MDAAHGRGDSHYEVQQSDGNPPPDAESVHLLHSTFNAKAVGAQRYDTADTHKQQQQLSGYPDPRPADKRPLDDCSNANRSITSRQAAGASVPLAHFPSHYATEVAEANGNIPPSRTRQREQKPSAFELASSQKISSVVLGKVGSEGPLEAVALDGDTSWCRGSASTKTTLGQMLSRRPCARPNECARFLPQGSKPPLKSRPLKRSHQCSHSNNVLSRTARGCL
jgi:hypothetical protein